MKVTIGALNAIFCGNTVPIHDAVETANEDAEIVYICKGCAEDEENEDEDDQ